MASTLKVNTIQHTGGTTGLTIDSAGRVLTPNRPAAQVAGMASNLTTSGTIIYNSIKIDTTNMYNLSTGKFTVPVAGVYLVTHTILGSGTAGANQYAPNTRVYKNNNGIGYGGAHSNLNSFGAGTSNPSAYVGASSTIIVQCSANDTIHIHSNNASASNLLNSTEHAFCAVYLL
tara:strand:- start:246 stop:767 length:522 start_codon:yes stop_codon:yes gene_type:complete